MVASQKDLIVKNVITHIRYLLDNNYIHVYLNGVSGGLTKALVDEGLTTSFRDDQMYFWDYNNSYNKIDRFVSKEIAFVNDQ